MADAKGAYIGGVPVQFKDAAARAMISDEYNSAETYAKGNLCIYNGKIYEAIKETTGTWDATAWEETTLAKVNGKLNGDIASLTENIGKVSNGIPRIVTFEQQASPVTLQFSGNVQTRQINAILLLSSQGTAIPPIAVGFCGSGGYENIEKNTAYVSSGLDGISIGASNGRITIPTFGGNWGTYSVVLLSNRLSVSQV